MFDEPFTGQDPISMGVILSLIKRLNEALNLTSIVVSHDVEEVLSIADYAYIIADQKSSQKEHLSSFYKAKIREWCNS